MPSFPSGQPLLCEQLVAGSGQILGSSIQQTGPGFPASVLQMLQRNMLIDFTRSINTDT